MKKAQLKSETLIVASLMSLVVGVALFVLLAVIVGASVVRNGSSASVPTPTPGPAAVAAIPSGSDAAIPAAEL